MNISVITVFPELYDNFIRFGIIAKAVEKKQVTFNFVRLSDMCLPKERIDEPTCGPGAGMIIKPAVLEKAIEHCEESYGKGFKIFFSPQGTKLTQPLLQKLAAEYINVQQSSPVDVESHSKKPHLILVCARYEGIDARVEEHYADLMISIGDYILMGGDLPAQVFIESFLRLMPGIIGKQASVERDSFSGSLLDYPEYGLPVTWKGVEVPPVLLSGNHAQIEVWRSQQAAQKTVLNRFDWLASSSPTKQEIELARSFIPNHYAALMHTDIVIKGGRVGESSIASVDIHDIARSGKTYGIKNFFVVTPLEDQLTILNTFLGFWHSSDGEKYNSTRHDAVSSVRPAKTFLEVVNMIDELEGSKPLVIATSARSYEGIPQLDYQSQSLVWNLGRPVLFLFGTGQGLSEDLLKQCDFILLPLSGLTSYNHLSVRSAAAIIFDRWLGLHPKKHLFRIKKHERLKKRA